MVVTESWIKKEFIKFNSLYFDGKLPMPIIKLSHARTQLGALAYKNEWLLGRRIRCFDYTIKLSTYYDMTERQAQNILIHEMIHYYIAYFRIRDSRPHGVKFQKMASDLNRKYGWEIKAIEVAKDWKVAEYYRKKEEQKSPRQYLVLALKVNSGKYYFCNISPKLMPNLKKNICIEKKFYNMVGIRHKIVILRVCLFAGL
ncbi:SprT-like domain-containing protein [Segatella albensis]|uniref:SprT-like domain-containing protein n=1 Tax=Segatella albensis TaxID=77768 RepID=UPI00068651D8|nr:SprT-like domain-containing protein [Segatella albensis]